MSLGCTLPAGIRRWVMSSSFKSRSTSAIESIRPDETSGVFSSIWRPGFLTNFTTWSIICCASGVTRRFLPIWFDRQFRMFCQQLLASGGARRFSGGALHDPLGRLEEDGADGHSHIGHNVATDFALNLVGLLEKLLFLHLCDNHDIFRSKIGIEHAQSNRATVVNCGMAADNLFDVLGIDVLATDDEQVFLAADDIKLVIEIEAEISGVIPAVANRLLGKIGAVVVPLKQRVALDSDLAYAAVLQHFARIGNDLHAIAGQQLA